MAGDLVDGELRAVAIPLAGPVAHAGNQHRLCGQGHVDEMSVLPAGLDHLGDLADVAGAGTAQFLAALAGQLADLGHLDSEGVRIGQRWRRAA
ncbi:hypothetical protein LBW94_005655 [Nocardia sp. alder85J]|nr:hypothetical protein [Nocardia sp. alder85J]MCX4091830.1 hypothetical protein [Nocardia sp. alder85J]